MFSGLMARGFVGVLDRACVVSVSSFTCNIAAIVLREIARDLINQRLCRNWSGSRRDDGG